MKSIDKRLVYLFKGSVIIYVLYGFMIFHSDIPDGPFYFRRSEYFVDLLYAVLRFDGPQIAVSIDLIVGKGWFLPATSILLSPVRLLTDDPYIAKLYIYAVNILLHFFICLKLKKVLGLKTAIGFHVLTLLSPLYNVLGMSFIGEILAGKLFILLVIYTIDCTRKGLFFKFNFR